ncbi:ABC transporter ATP-binding protein [Streptomyces sp. WMMB 322]|uniref:ABC transporter ATP-binding protein n=1 Tax=Streptomyces sp. WMMB 322 TaxID=1286821 RepID=UPI0006E163A0|nr:ABC transporter ATP-binding protein [Streptomyces sp. WMMB 322]SCK26098.1 peptide/nickel transport system ATP-binding protein [Streptomyces sp. WMMB 322]
MTQEGPMKSPGFAVRDLTVVLGRGTRAAHVVRGVSWSVAPGATLGVVGESGSGKSMTVLAAAGLVPPSAAVTGSALVGSTDLLKLSRRELEGVRGRRLGFVFQEPMTSLNPLLTVERQITEGIEEHLGTTRRVARGRALELLESVGIPDPERRLDAYPHQLSGGMRQRVMIAIALSCEPDVLIADEPTTALDVTTQAQILEIVRERQQRMGMAVVWISHDLGVVGGLADDVVVMYGGQVVEQAPVETLHRAPAHPYTRGLLGARPLLGSRRDQLTAIPGTPPDPRELPSGCVFFDRCPVKGDPRCETEVPALSEVGRRHYARTFCPEDQ